MVYEGEPLRVTNIIELLLNHLFARPQHLPGQDSFENIIAFNTNLLFKPKTQVSSFSLHSMKVTSSMTMKYRTRYSPYKTPSFKAKK